VIHEALPAGSPTIPRFAARTVARHLFANYESDEKPTMMSRDRHLPIVHAIERGDVDAAVQVVEQHMASAAAQYAPPDDRS
jgi:DNA-binding GntR family transcriptional regulator